MLYTIICDFAGGTYCSHVVAIDERDAVWAWAARLCADRAIPRRSAIVARNVLQQLAAPYPMPLDGLFHVRYFSALAGGDLIALNIIATEARPVPHGAAIVDLLSANADDATDFAPAMLADEMLRRHDRGDATAVTWRRPA